MLERFGKVLYEADLTNFNTYKLKVKSKALIYVANQDKLIDLIKYLALEKYKYFIIGNGSNIILPDYYDGVVIKLEFRDVIYNDNTVEVGASFMLNKLALDTVNKGLKGLEWAAGIPGTVGASTIINAGCYGGEITDYISKLTILEDNEIKNILPNDYTTKYRYTSLIDRNVIILKVWFKLEVGNKEEMLSLIRERTSKRIKDQPLEYPSAGSVFRNPEDDYAGRLIEELGLKGTTVGGAMISDKHANFIINYNNATSKDIINLINLVKNKIYEKYKVKLILEQQIIN